MFSIELNSEKEPDSIRYPFVTKVFGVTLTCKPNLVFHVEFCLCLLGYYIWHAHGFVYLYLWFLVVCKIQPKIQQPKLMKSVFIDNVIPNEYSFCEHVTLTTGAPKWQFHYLEFSKQFNRINQFQTWNNDCLFTVSIGGGYWWLPVLFISLMKSFVCMICNFHVVDWEFENIFRKQPKKKQCNTRWLAPFWPLCCTHIFSSYIFQSDFTFCLPLFSVHHHNLFLIAFSFPSQRRWQRQCRSWKTICHTWCDYAASDTHIWKMIIAFGLWILAYFCNIQNVALPTTRIPIPFSILFVSEHICRWQYYIML